MELFKNTWWGDIVLKKIAFHKGANHAKKAADGSHLQSIFSCIVLVLSFQWLHRHIVFEWLMHCGGGKYTYFFLQKLTIKISNSFVHSYDWQFWWGKHTVPVVDRFSLGLNLFSGTNHVLVSISHMAFLAARRLDQKSFERGLLSLCTKYYWTQVFSLSILLNIKDPELLNSWLKRWEYFLHSLVIQQSGTKYHFTCISFCPIMLYALSIISLWALVLWCYYWLEWLRVL